MIATITYRPNAQKTPGLFDAILTDAILTDICQKVTGQNKYRIVKDKSTYNKGRLVYVEYEGVIYYISLSEVSIEGRNSSLQSVPSAINLFMQIQGSINNFAIILCLITAMHLRTIICSYINC